MKTFRIKAKNDTHKWTYTGLFACGADAVEDAVNQGALAVAAICIR